MLTVGTILNRAFKATFEQPGVFFPISLMTHAPLFVLTVLSYQMVDDIESFGLIQVLLLGVALVTFLFLLPIQTGAMTYGVFQQLRGRPATLGQCLGAGLSRAGSLLAAAILSGLAILVGLVLCIIPGVIVAVGLFVVSPVVMVERDLGVVETLKRSWQLTEGHKWNIFGFLFVIGLVNNLLDQIGERVAVPLVVALGFLLIQVFFNTVQSVGQGVAYSDLRQIKEGTETDELVAVFD